uniref:Uncharacterized protein n=1 Tax=Sphaerodactylus townsendi TaxID=933632 RepID=A0ACB8FGG3_9SAUR
MYNKSHKLCDLWYAPANKKRVVQIKGWGEDGHIVSHRSLAFGFSQLQPNFSPRSLGGYPVSSCCTAGQIEFSSLTVLYTYKYIYISISLYIFPQHRRHDLNFSLTK